MRNLEILYNPEAEKIIEVVIKKANDSEAGRDVETLAIQTLTKLNLEIDSPKTFCGA